jgi:hypothetical protein
MSNLIATAQVRTGDLIEIDFDPGLNRIIFFKQAEDVPAYALVQLVGANVSTAGRAAASTEVEAPSLRVSQPQPDPPFFAAPLASAGTGAVAARASRLRFPYTF